MRILYCHDNIYQQCPDGTIYSPGQFPYQYWTPYLKSFQHLSVTGRGIDLSQDKKKMNVSSGPRVSFLLFPNINTLLGRFKFGNSTNKRLKQAVADSDGVIIRAVSDIGWLAYKHAKKMGKPIAMEMAACAWDSTWNHGSPYAKIYAPIRYMRDRIITKNADYVMYVSKYFLQERYPTNAITENASNVRIDKPSELLINKRLHAIKKREEEEPKPQIIGLIGNLNNKIKGVADTIKALALVEAEKPGSFIFRHLGPGNAEPYIKLAHELQIGHLAHFDGMIKSGSDVLEWLDGIDLYLQPSYQEGVPRATIEAMSRGCPVIASHAGGIPELIDKKWLMKPGDIDHLASLIIMMMDSPKSQIEAISANHLKSTEYTNEHLAPRRRNFWQEFGEFCKKSR